MARRALVLRATGLAAVVAVTVVAARAGWGADVTAWLATLGYGVVMVTFARTLLPGREPLIATYCRIDAGRVPDECLAYTRGLTALWAVLTGALAVESAAIQLSGHAGAWLAPVGMVNLALMVGLFVGEHWLRGILFPQLPKPSLRRTGQAMLRSVIER